MLKSNPELVGHGLADSVVTPARAKLITGYESVKAAAIEAGAVGVTVGGSGPTILAIPKKGQSRAVASAMVGAFFSQGIHSSAYQTRIGGGVDLYLD
jgi:homoserine kinase